MTNQYLNQIVDEFKIGSNYVNNYVNGKKFEIPNVITYKKDQNNKLENTNDLNKVLNRLNRLNRLKESKCLNIIKENDDNIDNKIEILNNILSINIGKTTNARLIGSKRELVNILNILRNLKKFNEMDMYCDKLEVRNNKISNINKRIIQKDLYVDNNCIDKDNDKDKDNNCIDKDNDCIDKDNDKDKDNNCIDKDNDCIDKDNDKDKDNDCIDNDNDCIDKDNNCIDEKIYYKINLIRKLINNKEGEDNKRMILAIIIDNSLYEGNNNKCTLEIVCKNLSLKKTEILKIIYELAVSGFINYNRIEGTIKLNIK